MKFVFNPFTGNLCAYQPGSGGNSFSIIQPITGTSPTAASPTDTLINASSDGSIGCAGNSSTDTLDWSFTGTLAASATFLIKHSGVCNISAGPASNYIFAQFNPSSGTADFGLGSGSDASHLLLGGFGSHWAEFYNGSSGTTPVHLVWSTDALSDLGTIDGGTTKQRPRDIWLSRDLRIGNGLQVKEGTNLRMGVATLAAGTVTVANTSVTANTRVFLTVQTAGGTQGFLSTTRVAGTSFTINSTSATETSTVAWLLVEPN